MHGCVLDGAGAELAAVAVVAVAVATITASSVPVPVVLFVGEPVVVEARASSVLLYAPFSNASEIKRRARCRIAIKPHIR